VAVVDTLIKPMLLNRVNGLPWGEWDFCMGK